MKKLLLAFSILVNMVGFSQVANYGYTATSSPWTANPASPSSTTIHAAGALGAVATALPAAISIGFNFTYNNVVYSQFKASVNGFITFNTANTLSQPTNNLKTSTERVILAVLWDSNRVGSSGTVNYKLTGSTPNRIMTIEWLNYRWNLSAFSAGVISCQIQLFETTNIIKYNYYRGSSSSGPGAYTFQNSSNSTGFGASIGLGGATSGDFLSLSDLKTSPYPTKSTTVENKSVGRSPTNFSASGSMDKYMVTTYIAPNVSPNDATTYIFYPPLANDNCSGGTSISVNNNATCTSTTSGTTLGASQTLAACVGTADDDVWYSFVATQTVHVATETPGTIGDAVMQVYSGSCASLSTIACINDATTGNETTTLTNLTVGSTYYVRVHSFANGSGQGTFTMCVNTPPTIITSGALASFGSCSGSVSTEQNYTISGSGLSSNNITITAPTGFEVSTTSGSGFTSPLTLTPSSGVVSSTTIYVRLKSDATGSPSGNITNVSTNATTQNVAVSGTVDNTSVGGSVASNQTISSGGSATTINLSGNIGSVVKWQYDIVSTFATATDVVNTTTSVLGSSMGVFTQTKYYRAVVQNGTCPAVNSAYVTITVATGLPIELLYFNGVRFETVNKLSWSTASEKNNDYFNIEKTKDGNDWIEIVNLPGAGSSTTQIDYSFIDNNTESIINYYRLKQTDYDGKFKYSDMISIDNREGSSKEIYRVVNALGQEVDLQYYRGLVIIEYSDGSSEKIIK